LEFQQQSYVLTIYFFSCGAGEFVMVWVAAMCSSSMVGLQQCVIGAMVGS
jgi:hypothetical protein